MKHDFLKSSDWHKVASRISEEISKKSIAALDTEITDSTRYAAEIRYTAGYITALRDILKLPNLILTDDDEDKAINKEERDVLRLNGSPHEPSNRALTNFRG